MYFLLCQALGYNGFLKNPLFALEKHIVGGRQTIFCHDISNPGGQGEQRGVWKGFLKHLLSPVK